MRIMFLKNVVFVVGLLELQYHQGDVVKWKVCLFCNRWTAATAEGGETYDRQREQDGESVT